MSEPEAPLLKHQLTRPAPDRLPDMSAEPLAARVNIKTCSALANPGFHGYPDLNYSFVELGEISLRFHVSASPRTGADSE